MQAIKKTNQCTGDVESEQGCKVMKIQYLLLLTTVYTQAKQIVIQYSRTPITQTRITRTPRSLTQTKYNIPWISPHFPVIFTQSTRTRKTRIPRQLELKFLSLDQKITATW